MYWGNAGASDAQNKNNVWDSNFVMVQHMNQNSGNINDSTSGNYSGTATGTVTYGKTGQVNSAIGFDGSSTRFSISSGSPFTFADTTFTVEAWLNGSTGAIVARDGLFGGWVLFRNQFIIKQGGGPNNGAIRTTATSISSNNWYFISAVATTSTTATADNNITLYLNGNVDQNDITKVAPYGLPTTSNLDIGWRNTLNNYFNGTLDEIRISTTTRSASWISAEYASMTDSLITYGDPPGSFDLSSFPDGSYLNYGSFPITFSKATTTLYPVNKYQIIIDQGKEGETLLVDGIPAKGDLANHSKDHYHQTNTWKASYDREDDTDTSNDRITISNIPDTTTILQGNTTTIYPLKEGKRTITIRAIDERGNTRDETKTLYLDYHKPLLSGVTINGSLLTPRKLSSSSDPEPSRGGIEKSANESSRRATLARTVSYTTTSTRPTISGQLQDLPVGDYLGLANKDKTLGNIKGVYITITDAGSGKPITTQEATLSANDCPKQLEYPDRPDLERGCVKSFLFKPITSLSLGTYKVTIEGKDKAGNLSLPITILLTVTSPELTSVPEEQPTPTFTPTPPLTPIPTPILTPKPTPTIVL